MFQLIAYLFAVAGVTAHQKYTQLMLHLRIKYQLGTISCCLSATETLASMNRSRGKLKGKGHSCIGIVRLSSDVVYSINMVCVGSSCLFFLLRVTKFMNAPNTMT